jgi:hypothetical protein
MIEGLLDCSMKSMHLLRITGPEDRVFDPALHQHEFDNRALITKEVQESRAYDQYDAEPHDQGNGWSRNKSKDNQKPAEKTKAYRALAGYLERPDGFDLAQRVFDSIDGRNV